MSGNRIQIHASKVSGNGNRLVEIMNRARLFLKTRNHYSVYTFLSVQNLDHTAEDMPNEKFLLNYFQHFSTTLSSSFNVKNQKPGKFSEHNRLKDVKGHKRT